MGSSVIFAGTKVKTLKSTIDLNGGNDIISSTTDPTSSAVSANIGSLLLNSSNGKLYRKNDSGSSTNWTEVGASGQAGINYISNPNADLNTTGWSTYADAAGSAPVDGTGGSPSVTWTRSTATSATTPTTPLRGAANFVFAKDAVNRQGQGVSVDFTIDKADQAKPLTVTFDYQVLTGTYATGDLTVYLIADPAGTPVVIQPAGYQVQSAVAGTKMRNIALFQTQASGVSYRLCFHVASTSASAYDLAIDNVVCGPQVVQYGAPVTDWESWTPTGSWTSNVTYTGKRRRIGDSYEFDVTITCSGAPTAANLTINTGSLTIDTAKLTVSGNDNQQLGYGVAVDTGTNSYPVAVNYATTTSVAIRTLVASGTYASESAVNATVPITFGNTDTVQVRFIAPISGLSSTVVMSNDTDTRIITGTVSKSGTQSITGGVSTKVTGWTVNSDDAGTWDNTNNRFTVVVPGYYRISSIIRVSSASVSASYKVNGGSVIALSGYQTVLISGSVKSLTKLNAGDYIELFAFTSTNDTISASDTMFQIERLTGPSAIASSESVNLRVENRAATPTSVSGSNFLVPFATKVFDSHSGWNGTDTYTVPVSGKYLVSVQIAQGSAVAWTVNGGWNTYLFKNGSQDSMISQAPAQAANTFSNGSYGTIIISCNAGDTLQIKLTTSATFSLNNTAGLNVLSILRVGN